MKKLNLAKVKKTIHKNKQLFIGLAIGVLVMLPTGIYVNERNSNRQADQPSTTLETKADNDSTKAESLEPATEQPAPTQNNSQPSASSNKPTSTIAPTPTVSKPSCYDIWEAENSVYYAKKNSITAKKRTAEDSIYYEVLDARTMAYEEARPLLIAVNTEANQLIDGAFATYKANLIAKGCASNVGNPPTHTEPLPL